MWDHSRTARLLRAVTATFTRAREASVLAAGFERLGTRAMSVVRTSYCYRRLTAEPEPEIIVVDLRKTRTVALLLELVAVVVDPVERAWERSRLSSVTTVAGAAVSRSRTGDVLAVLLDPPETDTAEKAE